MREQTDRRPTMFVMINMESRSPADHPLRAIEERRNAIFAAMLRDFDAAYSKTGRPRRTRPAHAGRPGASRSGRRWRSSPSCLRHHGSA